MSNPTKRNRLLSGLRVHKYAEHDSLLTCERTKPVRTDSGLVSPTNGPHAIIIDDLMVIKPAVRHTMFGHSFSKSCVRTPHNRACCSGLGEGHLGYFLCSGGRSRSPLFGSTLRHSQTKCLEAFCKHQKQLFLSVDGTRPTGEHLNTDSRTYRSLIYARV